MKLSRQILDISSRECAEQEAIFTNSLDWYVQISKDTYTNLQIFSKDHLIPVPFPPIMCTFPSLIYPSSDPMADPSHFGTSVANPSLPWRWDPLPKMEEF